ncbi:polysaccharide biosynthesis/export family protein [uncultured Desulfobacter sp.]|uniref:polysaccharide biosynthesis/export family protein n=1 Tax=uncultured Desulfobacter sp. TaxID=240139 RepID=UPI0029F590A6|nr:polysaccharide biosynthesis/export family protein [uncultured Desulfobacter sp.]
MKLLKGLVIGCLFLACWAMTAGAGEYRIGAGDALDISVWKNADLTRQRVVLPDGTIQMPLLGQVMVEGKTVVELEKELTEKLIHFISNPVLSVSLLQVNSMVVYVIGKVNHPGRFAIHKNVDVLQALSVAGGLTPFAKEKEIGIFRKIDGQTKILNFNYDEVSEGENLDQNIMLQRDDVIVVR